VKKKLPLILFSLVELLLFFYPGVSLFDVPIFVANISLLHFIMNFSGVFMSELSHFKKKFEKIKIVCCKGEII